MCHTDRQRRCCEGPCIQACTQRCALGPWACTVLSSQGLSSEVVCKGQVFFPLWMCCSSVKSLTLTVSRNSLSTSQMCMQLERVRVGMLQPAGSTGQGREALLSDQLGIPLRRSICRGHVSELQQYLPAVNEPMLTVHSAACMLTRGSICRVL